MAEYSQVKPRTLECSVGTELHHVANWPEDFTHTNPLHPFCFFFFFSSPNQGLNLGHGSERAES